MQELPAEAPNTFVWWSPLERLQHLLMNPALAGRVRWRCGVKRNEDGVRIFEDITTADAGITAEERFCKSSDEHVLIISFYADGTALSGDGRVAAHPIYMELMQLHDEERLAFTAPMLVGLIPVIKGGGDKLSETRLRLYQQCMDVLAEDLKAGASGLWFAGRFGKPRLRSVRVNGVAVEFLFDADAFMPVACVELCRCRRRSEGGEPEVLPAFVALQG